MGLKDYKGIFTTNILKLKEIQNPFGDYYIFDFDSSGLTWETGEHAFFIAQKKLEKDRGWRALSIASNHEEGIMRIATRITNTPSNFKKYLKNMNPGDTMKVRGPFGSFKIKDQTSPIIMIAGGIGVAPIRALLERVKNERNQDIVLLYSSRDGYVFKDEFDKIASQNNNIHIEYIDGRDNFTKMVKKYSDKYTNNGYYYLSGTPTMIKGITNNLKENNIKNNRLLNDPFYGY